MALAIPSIPIEIPNLLNPGLAIFVAIGAAILGLVGIYAWMKLSNREVPMLGDIPIINWFIEQPKITAILIEKRDSGYRTVIDKVRVQVNPETNATEYYFLGRKMFFPAWRFGHISANNFIFGLILNRDEIHPCPVVFDKAEVTNPITGKTEMMDIARIKPIISNTLKQHHILKQQNIRSKYEKKQGWLETMLPIITVGVVAIGVAIILYVAMSNLTPLIASMEKNNLYMSQIVSNLGALANSTATAGTPSVPTPPAPPI